MPNIWRSLPNIWKFCQIYRKTPVPESLFLIKLLALGVWLYLKRDSGTGVFLWIGEIYKNIFFYKTPLMAASVHGIMYWWFTALYWYWRNQQCWYFIVKKIDSSGAVIFFSPRFYCSYCIFRRLTINCIFFFLFFSFWWIRSKPQDVLKMFLLFEQIWASVFL